MTSEVMAFDHVNAYFTSSNNTFPLISFLLLPDTFVALNGKYSRCYDQMKSRSRVSCPVPPDSLAPTTPLHLVNQSSALKEMKTPPTRVKTGY